MVFFYIKLIYFSCGHINVMLSKELLLQMFRTMVTIRKFEEGIAELYARGLVPYDPHLSIGQEAVATGVCLALSKDDYVLSTHRSHAHAIAKGIPLDKLAAEILGKATGCCKGRGGTMRPVWPKIGLLYSCPIVGSNIPIATGVALGSKLMGSGRVAVAFFGDGASNTGEFHEGLNLASIWKLPVVFVCENNQYAISVSVKRSTSVENISKRACAYNIPSQTVDGMDVEAVYWAASEAVKRARKGEGPTLIECKTYRFRGHDESDRPPWPYRTEEEVEEWKKRDPIINLKNKMLSEGVASTKELNTIEKEVEEIVRRAMEFAEKSPYPSPEELMEYVY